LFGVDGSRWVFIAALGLRALGELVHRHRWHTGTGTRHDATAWQSGICGIWHLASGMRRALMFLATL
jgi:hypothetical protein